MRCFTPCAGFVSHYIDNPQCLQMHMATMSSHVSMGHRSAQHAHIHPQQSAMSASSHSTQNGTARSQHDLPGESTMTSQERQPSRRSAHAPLDSGDMHNRAQMGPAGVHGMRRPPSGPVQLPPHMHVYGVGAHANKELMENVSPGHGGTGRPGIYVDNVRDRESPQQIKNRQVHL